jgi:type IV pilus assembly protein PilC
MPTFQYEAMNSVGQVIKDQIDATSSEDAIAKIRSQGHFPTKIKEMKSAKGGKSKEQTIGAAHAIGAPTRRRRVGRVKLSLMTTFTRQLSTLQDAGLPILRSLRILEEQQRPGPLRMALRMVADDVEGGRTLSEAMAQHPKAFDKLYTNMVAAGEAGGVLDIVLRRLADFMEASQKLKKRVIGAMIYPVAVITFATAIVSGIMMFIIPKFKDIFSREFGSDLPAVTKALMDFSEWMGQRFG